MRRFIFTSMGILEAAVAVVLLGFAWYLPGPADVHDKVARVEKVSKQSSGQVAHLRSQVQALRARQPSVRRLAQDLDAHTREITSNLKAQQVDYATVLTVSNSLGDAAKGLDSLAQTLDPKDVKQLGDGFGATADFLDRIAPTADKSATDLEKALELLRTDALRLAALLREAPLDLKAARELNESLAKFSDNLKRMSETANLKDLEAMREGFDGLEMSLSTGADQVARMSNYTYPVVTFNGFRPQIDQRAFWPEGEQIADGMRKAAKGAGAAKKEMARMREDLPHLKESLDDSRRIIDKTREALAQALKQQEVVEPLLKDVPEHAARLAEELPKLGTDLAKMLRDTHRLKDIAAMLRATQKRFDTTLEQWPEIRTNLGRSADLLRAMQVQVKNAVDHRSEYEASLEQTLFVIRTFASVLPLLTEELENELQEQERSLDNLGASIDDLGAALPACEQTATRILTMIRLLMVLVAGIFGLHGGYLGLGSRLGVRYSG